MAGDGAGLGAAGGLRAHRGRDRADGAYRRVGAARSLPPAQELDRLRHADGAQGGDPDAAAAAVGEALAQLPSLGALYVSMLKHGAEAFAELARLVATGEVGVLVHCTAGKDRTGVAIALLLDAVGAQRDAVVADYAASESNLSGAWADGMFAVIDAMGVPRTPTLDELVAATPPAAIEEALAWVDREHGGSAAYLRSGGLTEAELAALRRRLTG